MLDFPSPALVLSPPGFVCPDASSPGHAWSSLPDLCCHHFPDTGIFVDRLPVTIVEVLLSPWDSLVSLGSRAICVLVTHWPVGPAWPPLTLLPCPVETTDTSHSVSVALIPFAFSQAGFSHRDCSPRGPSQKPRCHPSSPVSFPACPSTLTLSLHSHHHLAGSGDLDLSLGSLSLTALLTFG